MHHDARAPGGFAHDGYVAGIASEPGDIVFYPGQTGNLIHKRDIARTREFGDEFIHAKEAQRACPVIDTRDNDAAPF